jgi:hypothetical protein
MNLVFNILFLYLSIDFIIFGQATTGQYTGAFGNYQNSVDLTYPEYKLHWNATNMTFIGEVNVKAKGWVSFGFSRDGRMIPANVMVTYANPDGSPNFSERYNWNLPVVGSYRTPNQNWNLLNYRKTGDVTMVQFSRPIILCSPNEINIRVCEIYFKKF